MAHMTHSILPDYLLPYLRYSALAAPPATLFLSKLFFRNNKGVQIVTCASATIFTIRTVIGPHLDQMAANLTQLNGLLGR